MGSVESILINEKENGIFNVNVKDYPEYPIAYIRLCFDKIQNKYCILTDCDIEDKFLKNPLYFSPISAAVGLHAGYGCLGIAVLFEEK